MYKASWFSVFSPYNVVLLHENSTLTKFCFDGLKMPPVSFNIALELVPNTLVDAAGLSAAYTYVSNKKLNKKLAYTSPNILFFLFLFCTI